MTDFLALVAASALTGLYIALNVILVRLLLRLAGTLSRAVGRRSTAAKPRPGRRAGS